MLTRRNLFIVLFVIVAFLAVTILVISEAAGEAEKPAVQSSQTIQPPTAMPVFTVTATARPESYTPTPTPTSLAAFSPSPTLLPILFPHTKACEDGADNDYDGLFDLADPQCRNEKDNNESK